ncbi:MAG: sigma-54-dependent transcriptional regulator [Kofleriaceae bacterium]
MRSPAILMVDDDRDFADVMADGLTRDGHPAGACYSGEACLQRLCPEIEIVVSDIAMKGMTGVELCARIRERWPHILTIVVTASHEADDVIAAMRAGAWDYLTKPFTEPDLALAVAKARDHLEVTRMLRRLEDRPASVRDGIVGASAAVSAVHDLIDRAGPTDATVLVTGESGTGKELVARALHARSRADQPFVAINCSAMPSELLESELFGYAQGAFTDARRARDGLFVVAGRGTIFLDEIGDMSLAMQAKLLRALQERTVRRVGGSTEVPIRARIVAATNRDLTADIAERRFREDLYYRLDVVRIPVPSLRERREDILGLAQHFLLTAASRTHKPVRRLSAWAARKLLAYDWPGNIRELENCMERAVALCRLDEITVADLPQRLLAATTQCEVVGGDALGTLDSMVIRYVENVLSSTKGNKTRAAGILGIDRRSIYRILERRTACD